MPLFEMTDSDFRKIEPTSFGVENIRERQDLQRLLKDHIAEIAPDCKVIAEEFSNWEDSLRRIDLLCVDRHGNLVVVELKRDQTGQHMELQALRYAAMVSTMTFAQAVETFEQYLPKDPNKPINAAEELSKFITDGEDEDASSPPEERFNRKVTIILVSSGFSKELTTTVLWLQDQNVDIRCVRMTPYRHEGKLLVQTEQVLPLPEAEEYQIQIATKQAEANSVRTRKPSLPKDLTFEITVCGQKYRHLQYKQAAFQTVELLMQCGVSLEQIRVALPAGRLVFSKGRLTCNQMEKAIEEMEGPRGAHLSARDYYCEDDDLIFDTDRTWALRRLSQKRTIHRLDRLKRSFPTKLDFQIEAVSYGTTE